MVPNIPPAGRLTWRTPGAYDYVAISRMLGAARHCSKSASVRMRLAMRIPKQLA